MTGVVDVGADQGPLLAVGRHPAQEGVRIRLEAKAFHRDHVPAQSAGRIDHDVVILTRGLLDRLPLHAAHLDVGDGEDRIARLVEDVRGQQLAQGTLHGVLADGVLGFIQADVGDFPAVGINHDADDDADENDNPAQHVARRRYRSHGHPP